MWELFASYYTDVVRATFEVDLDGKSHVILLRDADDDSLQGFSTVLRTVTRVQGRQVAAVFSGDTLVAKPYWGQTALQRAFYGYIGRTKLRYPLTPVVWFLISKGYRTYLLLARNFPEFWPRRERPTPPWPAAVLTQLARERFGDTFDAERGILSAGGGRLQSFVAPIEEASASDPDALFFETVNPGHANGDELCCIGFIDARMFIFYAGKTVRRSLRRAWQRTRQPSS